MADPTYEKCDDGTYQITNGEITVKQTPLNFEDCFYAVPQAPSYFYRLLTDSCCDNDEDRLAIRKMVEESELGMNAALDKLQAEIAALPEPEETS